MRVRAVLEAEWPRFRAMRLAALEEAPDAFGQTVEQALAQAEAVWRDRAASALVAEEAGEWLAVCMPRVRGEVLDVFGMWTLPAARGRGAGRAVLAAALEMGRAGGARVAELWVSDSRPEARRVYERAGFAFTGAVEDMRGTPIRQMARAL